MVEKNKVLTDSEVKEKLKSYDIKDVDIPDEFISESTRLVGNIIAIIRKEQLDSDHTYYATPEGEGYKQLKRELITPHWQDRPTEAGKYWLYLTLQKTMLLVVDVTIEDGRFTAVAPGFLMFRYEDYPHSKWMKIEQPEPPKE